MNPMLQRHCAKFIYIVPDGLRELMSDISREVIRSQPIEVYKFIADYLDALMITRENARIALRLVQNITEIAETTVGLLERAGLDRDEANKIATIIQINFREYLSRKTSHGPSQEEDPQKILEAIMAQLEVDEEKLSEVAVVIQNAYRSFKERQERERDMLFGMVDWRIAAKSAIALYRRTGVTMYEANRAATLIKAAYKGYYTRRVRKKLLLQSGQGEVAERFIEEEPEGPPTEFEELPSYMLREESVASEATQITEPTEEIFGAEEKTITKEEYLVLDEEQEDEGFTYTEVMDESVGEEAVIEMKGEGTDEERLMDESAGEEAQMEEETKTEVVEGTKPEEEETEAGTEYVEEELDGEFTESEFASTYAEQEPDEQEDEFEEGGGDTTEDVELLEQSEEEG